MVNTSDSGSSGRGFEPHSGRRVVSLSTPPPPPKKKKEKKKKKGSTVNIQEAVASSKHD